MNTLQFVTLFLGMLVGLSAALGEFEIINGAIPLLSVSGAGELATPLAILGVLKLGAAALLALTLLKPSGDDEEYYEPAASGYDHYRRRFRHKRSAAELDVAAPNPDAIFALISAMDTHGCGKQLICELESRPYESLANDEKLMITFFSKSQKLNAASPKAEYDLAAELGQVTKNELVCRHRYANCPYTAAEMMTALRATDL